MAQVQADLKGIKTADMLRLVFHFFNTLNLALAAIVCGVGISITVSSTSIMLSGEVSIIYGTLIITSLVALVMGLVGIHGCYWVTKNGLKFYAVLACTSMLMEVTLGSMTIMKEADIMLDTQEAIQEYTNTTNNTNHSEALLEKYFTNKTFRINVDNLQKSVGCCIFSEKSGIKTGGRGDEYHPNITDVWSCFVSNFTRITRQPYNTCSDTLTLYIRERLVYIRYIAFLMVPVQLICLFFDLLVLKTSKVTKDYEKLERELSNKARQRNTSYQIDDSDLLMEEHVALTSH